MSEETRTLLILHKDGRETQIDIPKDWKVTFGPAAVGMSKQADGKVPLALRIYESEKLQRAIFTDVVSFRDMSIPIRIKVTNVQEKNGYVELDGSRKSTVFQAKTTEWVNPDDPANESKQLPMPKDSELYNFAEAGARLEAVD